MLFQNDYIQYLQKTICSHFSEKGQGALTSCILSGVMNFVAALSLICVAAHCQHNKNSSCMRSTVRYVTVLFCFSRKYDFSNTKSFLY